MKLGKGWMQPKKILFILAFFMFIFIYIEPSARELGEDKEIVVVLDCSKSMEDVDSRYNTFDFIESIYAIVPRNYRIGMIAFDNEVCASIPVGSNYEMIEAALQGLEYAHYGNAGSGLTEALQLFKDSGDQKRIILISDGEIMMDSEEGTEESYSLFEQAVELAKEQGIIIDVITLGPRIEEGYTVYRAAETTGGKVYDLADGSALEHFTEEYLFDEWGLSERHVGKVNDTEVELTVKLPDCLMDKAKIVLLGKQQNDNMTVNGEAGRINVSKGQSYTVVELINPISDDVEIRMSSEEAMDISAYITAEYDFTLSTGHVYTEETQTAEIWLDIVNPDGKSLLEGSLREGGVTVYLDNDEQDYRLTDGKIYIQKQYIQDSAAKLEVSFDGLYADYYGDTSIEEEIVVPVVIEEPPETDWFFWSVIIFFIAALVLLFFLSWRRQRINGSRKHIVNDSRVLEKQNTEHKNNFFGKVQIFVIHNKDDIDYPPESINLFARCNREMITLEWILDTCNLPLNLKGAERIIIKPGDDKSLIIKNSSKATALMGRELLIKNHSYHLYYHEKVTFIFDEEDTEIEMHYKDLKPNER